MNIKLAEKMSEQLGVSIDIERPILSFHDEFRFLSNFWVCQFEYNDVMYNSSEHAFMAQKTLDPILQIFISNQPTPAKAKFEARKVDLRSDWEEVKFKIMYEVVFAKFSQNYDLREKLLNTENRYLEEGNTWHDKIWGVCWCPSCGNTGLNSLGQILMLVREQLKEAI